MLIRDLRSRILSTLLGTKPRRPIRRAARLGLERLDDRDVPAVTFNPIEDFTFPAGKDLLVPLTAADSAGNAVQFSVRSSDPGVTASVVSGNSTLFLTVRGKDVAGNDFSGTMALRLFGDIAPLAVARITELANSGFYNGKLFHRVINDFMAQGGSVNGAGSGDSGLGKFDDEFHAATTFVSPGLLAMANSGNDTNDTQFFIVDTDLALGRMPQHLNFKHTIFGQLVSGFDTYAKIIGTPVGPASRPLTDVVIDSATVSPDDSNGVLRVRTGATFTGGTAITVTATSPEGTAEQTFHVTAVADTLNDRPFLGALPAELKTQAGSPITLDLPATDVEGDPLTFVVRNPDNFTAVPANVLVTIDQQARRATITPKPGFTGSVDLLVGVRDQTTRPGDGPLDGEGSFNTQVVKLTVSNDLDLEAASDTGLYADDNYTTDDTPTFTVHAEAGRTVALKVNGTGSFAASEVGAGAYQVTLPAGTLRLGANTITATVAGGGEASRELAPLALDYAPTQDNVFVVPGAPGSAQQVNFRQTSAETAFRSEVGFFLVDDAAGRIGALRPGDPGYAKAALERAQTITTRDQGAGTTKTVSVQGGQMLGFYLIQDNTRTAWLAANPTNSAGGSVLAFFSFKAANPDRFAHVLMTGDPVTGRATYAWEDLTGGGDRDFNDRVFNVHLVGTDAPAALRVPAGPSRNVQANFKLHTAAKSALNEDAAAGPASVGEVGLFLVDAPDGRIGTLKPGDAGYVQAALAARKQIFAANAAAGASGSATLPGGGLFGFYLIDSGTAAGLLTANPNNAASGSVHAFFSFAAANPDRADHFRFFGAEQVMRTTPADTGPLQVHATRALNATSADFDDLLFDVTFAAIV